MKPQDGARPSRGETPAAWRLSLLGGPRLEGSGGPIRLDRRTAALLAYLALEGETPKYRLAGLLWPDSPEATAKNNMRQLLRRLRAAAGADLVAGEERIALADGVEADAAWLQARAFAGEHAAVLEFTGELLAGLEYDDAPDLEEWLLGAREGLDSLRRDAAAAEAERLEREGDLTEGLRLAQAALELDPLSEEAHRRIMRLAYLQGGRGTALASYERLREVLRREFGAEPMPETLALAREIERGGRVPRQAAPSRPPQLPLSVLRPPTLVGREREWAELEAAWERGQVIYISGEPGVGKTRLALDFAATKGEVMRLDGRPGDLNIPHATSTRNFRCVLARRPQLAAPEGLPTWVRRELARLLPELGADPRDGGEPPPLSTEADKLRFFEAQFEFVRLGCGDLAAVVVDDLQFYDEASVEFASYLFSKAFPLGPASGVPRFIETFRRSELPPRTEEALLGRETSAGIAALVELEPLPPLAVGELLGGLELPGASAELGGPLSRYTGGNPLFVLETLRHLFETGQLERGLPARLPPPGRVREVIERRLNRLSEGARRLARAAAVLGTEFSLERAAAVLEASPLDLGEPWAELEAAQVLKGRGFSHDLLFEATLEATPAPLRALLHRRTAQALASSGAHPAQVARHWLEGGEPARAAPALLEAARAAEAAYRHADAAAFFEQAGELLEAAGDADAAFETRYKGSRLLLLLGRGPATEAALTGLRDRTRTPLQRARTEATLAWWYFGAGRGEDAEQAALAGLEVLPTGADAELEGELTRAVLNARARQGRVEATLEAARWVAAKHANVPEGWSRSMGWMSPGYAFVLVGRYAEAAPLLERGERGFARIGDGFYQAMTLVQLAIARLGLGRIAQALEAAGAAEALLGEMPDFDAAPDAYGVREELGVTLVHLHALREEHALALEAAQRAEALRRRSGRPVGPSALARAVVALALGDDAGLEAAVSRALEDPQTRDAERGAALATRGLGLARRGGATGAEPAFAEAERLLAPPGLELPLARLELARAEAALEAHPEASLARARRALELARDRDLAGIETAAEARRALALLALGQPWEALDRAAVAAGRLAAHPPDGIPHAGVLLAHHLALAAVGDPGARGWLESALARVLETASLRVPPEFRASYIEANPVNRAVLEAARGAGLAVPEA